MSNVYRDIGFTDAVKRMQEEHGSRHAQAEAERDPRPSNDRLGESEALFLARADSFYMATVSQTGWPYVQHRGGPVGFLRVLDETRLGFADFAGNRHYMTIGNLEGDDRVSLFVMDYRKRRRLKIFGHARRIGAEDPATAQLVVEGYRARVERGILIEVAGFDWNCPQHIPERFSMSEVEVATARMMDRIAELEAELAVLKGERRG